MTRQARALHRVWQETQRPGCENGGQEGECPLRRFGVSHSGFQEMLCRKLQSSELPDVQGLKGVECAPCLGESKMFLNTPRPNTKGSASAGSGKARLQTDWLAVCPCTLEAVCLLFFYLKLSSQQQHLQ